MRFFEQMNDVMAKAEGVAGSGSQLTTLRDTTITGHQYIELERALNYC